MKKLLLLPLLFTWVSLNAQVKDTTKIVTGSTFETSYGKVYPVFYDAKKKRLFYMRTKKTRFYLRHRVKPGIARMGEVVNFQNSNR